MTPGPIGLSSEATAAAFPLGGIGTGNVSIGARGDLRDWEIQNRSSKGTCYPHTFFALRLSGGSLPEPVARVLEGPVPPPHAESHGYQPSSAAGLPRFESATLWGEYPVGRWDLRDDRLPVRAELEAFTPLVPLDAEASGIPCAVLEYRIHNLSDEEIDATVAGSVTNPVGGLQFDPFGFLDPTETGTPTNRAVQGTGIAGVVLEAYGIPEDNTRFGQVMLSTVGAESPLLVSQWGRGPWFDATRSFWGALLADDGWDDLDEPEEGERRPPTGTVGMRHKIEPGGSARFKFLLTWYFPNRTRGWCEPGQSELPDSPGASTVRNHYATRFTSALDVAESVVAQLDSLEASTRDFVSAFRKSTLPPEFVDAITANIVPVRTNTCYWLEDGNFYGWEGCFDDGGCCAGTCTHVWSYTYTVAALFPSLERNMRTTEFEVETEPDGYQYFRVYQPFGETFLWQWGDQKPEPSVDGQMGSVVRVWREWLWGGDEQWLRSLWPAVRNSLDYAGRHWDEDGDGLLDGKQHVTYDIEFYGPNPLGGIYYLAGLRAGEELARVVGDEESAQRFAETFRAGSAKLDSELFNGRYYVQKNDDIDANRYQHGMGCLSDQLLGQLHASLLGLGDLLPRENVRSAARAIFENNFREQLGEVTNSQRVYALNDEPGLLMCTWPDGGEPVFPFVYSDEVWTGVEYHVAASLVLQGDLAQARQVVRAARGRHNGVRRNPWDEVECGHHYARPMSSWALLLASTGLECDVSSGRLTFSPKLELSIEPDAFRAPWVAGTSWGTLDLRREGDSWIARLQLLGGEFPEHCEVRVPGGTGQVEILDVSDDR